jgi:hypothetical protein
MKITLIAFAFLLFQAPNPMPRKAPINSASTSSGTATKSKQNEPVATPSSSTDKPAPSETENQHVGEAGKKEQGQHVTVDSLPAKDAWDKGYIIAGWILVFAAIFTFGAICYQSRQTALAAKAARDTVSKIDRQANIMAEQTTAMEKSAKAANDSLAEIRRQAEIMERQTAVAEKSMRLQEIIQQQWVQIDGWRREGGGSREYTPPASRLQWTSAMLLVFPSLLK